MIANWQEHDDLGQRFANAIFQTYGTRYTVGNSAILLYPAYGASDDYAASLGVNLAYTIELPGGGVLGFDLPPSRIANVVHETWMGFQEMLKYVGTKQW